MGSGQVEEWRVQAGISTVHRMRAFENQKAQLSFFFHFKFGRCFKKQTFLL